MRVAHTLSGTGTGFFAVPANVTGIAENECVQIGVQRLPSEPVGNVTLTFPNIKPGSELHIFSTVSGDEIAGIESVVASQAVTLPLYGSGNAYNVVRVFIASLAYENLDFAYTLATSASIPTFQRIDRNYSNPP